MANTLKYYSFIKDLDDCPPLQSKEINMNAFRFIFDKRNHPDNFKPVLLIKPARINDRSFDTNEMKCSGYALSMFDSLLNSKNLFIKQISRNKNFGNNVGNYVAEICIESNEGVATDPSSKESELGHFDFFEYENTNFYNKIVNIEKLIS